MLQGCTLAHSQLVVYDDPQVIFCKASFQLFDLQPILLNRVIPPLVQDFVELRKIPTCPPLQAVAVLDGSTSGLSTTPPNYVLSINLLRIHSVPLSKSSKASTDCSIRPQNTPRVMGLQLDSVLLIKIL